ncbi:PREDICTED: 26S proteasome non-ATPase regulatory subunit 11 homolog [Tarenaya hassleriana]|uniref:26S proteasome non-ATPase regulatory subunit 11 homolog n=1 Tax=Tarenaya hassleriana TaxID=28532 RepID=UPI00053C1A1F|nr:PREDICTED: 26S proteasome non-ATPase regulatory subunit 11 homolog [Tarenaya hassleriana]
MATSNLPATTDSVAKALEAKSPSEAISILYSVLEDPSSSPEALRIKEQAVTNLSDILTQENKAEDLRQLLVQLRPFFSLIPKAKTAKIVRGIIDAVAKIPGTTDLQITLCKEMVDWTRAEKRTFLRQRVEARLAALLMENKEYVEALALLTNLVKEVRRLDDKLLLVDIDLLESKLHFSLRNLPKAKAALTAARTAANAIYVPPAQQGTIDLQSGILHAEEKDYKTAYSYFFEAFESFNALGDPRAIFSLKYMLLCKIMVSQADDVTSIISSKAGLQYVGPDLDAMKAVADAHGKRSLKLFENALRDYKAQLEEDPIVHRHLSSLYDTLLEQNLCRLIEPFSRVEIPHIAELIELPVDHVEKKLSQMILDKKFAGTLDQGAGCLIIFEDVKTDAIYSATLDTISNMGKVVDSLYARSAKIMA